ncbi:redox-sensitive transcriptional activator SoxR [Actinomadura sp. RB99]|uniref:redox-sensitive transcriptional activator SoxR n=1 Tax=Actinomadura sp. RB99 TaxID=2691577 RepID=UPI0016855760
MTELPLPAQAKELTIGELSRRSGVPSSTLRYYERQKLISSTRTVGNQRRYTRDTLRRVAFIRASQQVGAPLEKIRFYLSLLPAGRTPTQEDWARASFCYHQELQKQIDYLERLRDRLASCFGCGCLSVDACALLNPGDRLAEEGPGAVRMREP